MSEKPQTKTTTDQAAFSRQVGAKEVRKLKARSSGARSVWIGLGMMGIIGWSVCLPTLLGIASGIWLDHHHGGRHSWTLILLVVGLIIGCFTAWTWVAKEHKEIRDE